jgi:hypothetical protein
MNRIKRKLQFLICKILGIQYRHVLSEWELRNIVSRDARIYLGIGKDGVSSIIPVRGDSAADHSASNSFVYFLSREIWDFKNEVDQRLKMLDDIEPFTTNVPQLSALDELLRDTEDGNERPLSLLDQFEQELNEDEETSENERS